MDAPCTTFALGINPFLGLGAIPPTQPEPIMQKPAKPAKTKPNDEDYSTPYKPPMTPVVNESLTTQAPTIDVELTITNDPLPAKRAAPMYKYHPVFERMTLGQSLRTPSANVGKVAGALRKYIEIKGVKAHVKSQPRYCEDVGFGRVWLLAGVSKVVQP